MGENSKIEWCDHTANLWWGCTEVHEGCDHCYAEVLSHRWGNDIWGNDKPRKEIRSVWKDLLKYQKIAKLSNETHRVFVGSMMDIFEKPMPLIGANIPEYTTGVLRDRLFDQISEGWYNNLMFLFLTKRPSNINKYIPEKWKTNPPENLMFGTSPVNQATSNTLIPQLMKVKGKKFLSCEPMLGPIDLTYPASNEPEMCCSGRDCGCLGQPTNPPVIYGIDWVIVGGESGHGKRPFNTDWAREIKGQCQQYHVPFFFKQIDKVQPIPEDLMIREFPI